MKCRDIKVLIEKYELNEIDFIEKMILKSHIKKCAKCKKQYSSVLALGLILKSSHKAFSPSILHYIIGGTLTKYLLGLFIIGGIAIGTNEYNNYKIAKLEKEKAILSQNILIEPAKEEHTNYIKPKEKIRVDNHDTNNIKIRSRVENKELLINVDGNDNMRIKSKE